MLRRSPSQIHIRDTDRTWSLLCFRIKRRSWNWGQVWSHGKSESHISYSYGWGGNQKKVKVDNKAICKKVLCRWREKERERAEQTLWLLTWLPASFMCWMGGSSHPYKAGVGLGSLQLVHPVVLTFVECLLWAGLCSKPFTLCFLTHLIFSTHSEEQHTAGVFPPFYWWVNSAREKVTYVFKRHSF